MSESRKVHVLDDERDPTGPVLCGKTSTENLGPEGFQKGDRLCRRCALGLMARVNDYADQVNDLSADVMTLSRGANDLRRDLRKKDRMLLRFLERQFDAENAPMA
jgi:hypothetical protein